MCPGLVLGTEQAEASDAVAFCTVSAVPLLAP